MKRKKTERLLSKMDEYEKEVESEFCQIKVKTLEERLKFLSLRGGGEPADLSEDPKQRQKRLLRD